MRKKRINENFKHISPLSILNSSGFFPKLGEIEVAKKHCYTIIKDIAVTGDAPKDITRFYKYGIALKRNYKKWPIYIAKLGHKYYPMESITEQLITDIGFAYGFNMASSKISFIGGQIRFLSLFFLSKNEELYHGADMYAGFLNNDKKFVDEVEEKRMSQDFFTITFTKEVIDFFFKKKNGKIIYRDFMRMLFFDGLVGNNDRHMYNWGVIRNIFGNQKENFSPIYDTARGLLWNTKENKINDIIKSEKGTKKFIVKYCNNSKPKIGIESKVKVNHFELIVRFKDYYANDNLIVYIFANDYIGKVVDVIDTKYKKLLSNNRRKIITEILRYRYFKIKEILSYEK